MDNGEGVPLNLREVTAFGDKGETSRAEICCLDLIIGKVSTKKTFEIGVSMTVRARGWAFSPALSYRNCGIYQTTVIACFFKILKNTATAFFCIIFCIFF